MIGFVLVRPFWFAVDDLFYYGFQC